MITIEKTPTWKLKERLAPDTERLKGLCYSYAKAFSACTEVDDLKRARHRLIIELENFKFIN